MSRGSRHPHGGAEAAEGRGAATVATRLGLQAAALLACGSAAAAAALAYRAWWRTSSSSAAKEDDGDGGRVAEARRSGPSASRLLSAWWGGSSSADVAPLLTAAEASAAGPVEAEVVAGVPGAAVLRGALPAVAVERLRDEVVRRGAARPARAALVRGAQAPRPPRGASAAEVALVAKAHAAALRVRLLDPRALVDGRASARIDGVAADPETSAVWDVGEEATARLWERVRPHVGELLGPALEPRGFNSRLRLYRYDDGDTSLPHYDTAYDGVRPGERSVLSALVYLTDDHDGGCTAFFRDDRPPPGAPAGGAGDGLWESSVGPHVWDVLARVRPRAGSILLFPHGEDPRSALHEGSPVHNCQAYPKLVIRTDVFAAPAT